MSDVVCNPHLRQSPIEMEGMRGLTIQDQFDRALTRHQAGHLAEAERLYRAILADDPKHLASRHLLGVIMAQGSHPAEGISLIQAAAAEDPQNPFMRNNLAFACNRAGDHVRAMLEARTALQLRPKYGEAYHNLGEAQAAQGQFADAEASFREAVRHAPNLSGAHSQLAIMLEWRGAVDDACESYRMAVKLAPGDARSHMRLGALLLDRGDREGSEDHLRRTLELVPDHPEACYGLAQVLLHRSAFVEAEHYARIAVAQRFERAEFHHLLGLIMTEAGDWDAAALAFSDAVARDRRYVSALATVYFLNGRSDKAVTLYRQAIADDPEFPIPHYNLGQVLMRRGEFEEGWVEYEWRWRLAKFTSPKRNFAEPEWQGGELGGRTLLVHFEQGAGDVIQFARYLYLLPRDGRIIFEVQPSLVALFEGFAHIDQVVPAGSQLPAFDCQITLLNLPRYIEPNPARLPEHMPYLTVDPAKRKAWKKKLDGHPGLKIGVVWTGGRATPADVRRSVSAAQLAELGPIDGVTFVSLQKAEVGLPKESTADWADRPDFVDWMDEVTSFADTAALIDCLDLVLGVDTAVIHLAGALNRPVWLANRFDSCWRWGERAGESVWYPSLREFRQSRPGDWAGVFSDIRKALAVFTAK